jgi:cellobiose-specific phosphotransferase system component IIA
MKTHNEFLEKQLDEANNKLKLAHAAMQKFVDKVEAGLARSKETCRI